MLADSRPMFSSRTYACIINVDKKTKEAAVPMLHSAISKRRFTSRRRIAARFESSLYISSSQVYGQNLAH